MLIDNSKNLKDLFTEDDSVELLNDLFVDNIIDFAKTSFFKDLIVGTPSAKNFENIYLNFIKPNPELLLSFHQFVLDLEF